MKTLGTCLLLGLTACANNDPAPEAAARGAAADPVAPAPEPEPDAPEVEVELPGVEEVEVAPVARTPVEKLHALIDEVAARPEHDAEVVQVAHILIAFKGAERSSQIRTQDEAELLAADILVGLEGGADFETLVTAFTNDGGRGPYTMSLDGSAGAARGDMTPSFGDVAWRLEVGEIGACAYDPERSSYGWHIIKRLK